MSQPIVDGESEPVLQDLGGKYHLLMRLGQGGSAFVYLAVAQGPGGFNKLVVVKTPKPEVVLDPESTRMFRDEARLAARLNHANIVQTNEIAEARGSPVIVMEYLEGQPFSAVLARGREQMPLAMQLRIVAEALSGLHYAHESTDFDGSKLNVVHRDVSPHNVFVTFDGQVKILDFGIAKLDRSEHRSATGVLKGKLKYMPPEQIAGEKVDRRADIFAVGVILWDIIAGEELWKREPERSIMNRVLNGEIPSPREKNPDASPELERICMKALAAEPANRYTTAAELQAEIEAFIEATGIRVTSRELGKVVATVFEAERAETEGVIQAHLSKVAGVAWSDADGLLKNAELGRTGDAAYSQTRQKDGKSSRRPSLAVLVVIGGVALAALLFFWIRPRNKPDRAPSESVAASSPSTENTIAPSAAPPAVPLVNVQIAASPAGAKLFLDDAALASNPFSQTMSKDDKPHALRAEAPNCVTMTTSIVLDRDVRLVLTLEPAKAKGGDRPPSLPRQTSAKPQCSPPYYFDDQGTKKFKPECL